MSKKQETPRPKGKKPQPPPAPPAPFTITSKETAAQLARDNLKHETVYHLSFVGKDGECFLSSERNQIAWNDHTMLFMNDLHKRLLAVEHQLQSTRNKGRAK